MTPVQRAAIYASCALAAAAGAGAGCETKPVERVEKYVGGTVKWTDGRADKGGEYHSYVGDFEVTYGERYVTVRAKEGVFVFPREHLISTAPNVATLRL